MRKDSGFDPEYDEDRDGRQGRTHRARPQFANKSESAEARQPPPGSEPLPDRLASSSINWDYFGETQHDRAANIFALLEKYKGKSLYEAREQMRQERHDESRESERRLNEHADLMQVRLDLMSR